MRIASWNVNSLRVRLEHVLTWLRSAQPDVLALQETKLVDDDFPADAFAELGYEVAFSGQRTYNGVALLSRGPLVDISAGLADYSDEQKRVLAASVHGVRIVDVYVPNGQSITSEKYQYKLAWLAALRAELERELARHEHLVVLGDFNIAPEDRDVHDPSLWSGQVLCSEPERMALGTLLELGLKDVFRLFGQAPGSFSWWDYRQGAFRRGFGLRIDLILSSPALAACCRGSSIDIAPRKWERPSDHAPVVAEFDIR
jgi:exodeoxyribonuclease-3